MRVNTESVWMHNNGVDLHLSDIGPVGRCPQHPRRFAAGVRVPTGTDSGSVEVFACADCWTDFATSGRLGLKRPLGSDEWDRPSDQAS